MLNKRCVTILVSYALGVLSTQKAKVAMNDDGTAIRNAFDESEMVVRGEHGAEYYLKNAGILKIELSVSTEYSSMVIAEFNSAIGIPKLAEQLTAAILVYEDEEPITES